MVLAPIQPDRLAVLRALLATMNRRPGLVDPDNALLPFARFERLHFARFVVVDDATLDEIAVYGLPRRNPPVTLAFLGDCDGPAGDFLADLVDQAGDGLRHIFSHCVHFPANGDLLGWMRERQQAPATVYVNWVGRTVVQVREERAVHDALVSYMDSDPAVRALPSRKLWQALRAFVAAEAGAGRLRLTPRPSRLAWRVWNALHALWVLLVVLVAAPFVLLGLPVFLWLLRRHERRDPEINSRPDPTHVARCAVLEDHDLTNQFSAIGTLKPGRLRRSIAVVVLWILNNAGRHIYSRGHLARVGTIHCARWVFLDDKQRLLFASNYDGSLESYMDDFINKAAFGLNLVFSNGVGYPRTEWLLRDGARFEQRFKHFLRRHQLATDVWYDAHPGLTALDMERNTRIRNGLERRWMTERRIREWLRLL
jgi:hypothetical protein